MGSTLSHPICEKHSEEGGNIKFKYAISEMQGWRITMEDSHAIDLALDEQPETTNAFFAVYDGHGGSATAKYAGQHVHKRLIADDAYKQHDYKAALKNAFLGADEDLRRDSTSARDSSGCTAVAALVTGDNHLFVANAGDSRSVISVKGEVKPLSFDHKPGNDTERSRIVAAGGYIEFGRVNGNLALARALGDFDYKMNKSLAPEAQIITADPEITEHEISEDDEFIIIACDGIWDCLTSQQAVDCVRLLIAQGHPLKEICEIICDHCLAPDTSSGAGIGCDNMTILIVALLHGRTEEEWYQWVKDRVAQKQGHEVPSELPQLYSPARLASFRARQKAEEERERSRRERQRQMDQDDQDQQGSGGGSVMNKAELWGRPVQYILPAFFAPEAIHSPDLSDDSDDESTKTETDGHHGGQIQNLRAQLAELDDDEDGDAKMGEIEDEEVSKPSKSTNGLQGEAPPPPKQPNGDASQIVQQLVSEPGGDAPSDAVRAEGLSDSSESPFKV